MQLQYQLLPAEVVAVAEDRGIRRHEIANRLTKVERRLMPRDAAVETFRKLEGAHGVKKEGRGRTCKFGNGIA